MMHIISTYNAHQVKSDEFYLRAVIGSTNYRTGGDANDFMHGWLNYQIGDINILFCIIVSMLSCIIVFVITLTGGHANDFLHGRLNCHVGDIDMSLHKYVIMYDYILFTGGDANDFLHS
jgi:Ca2+-binding RTX toxin-like protein